MRIGAEVLILGVLVAAALVASRMLEGADLTSLLAVIGVGSIAT